MRLWRITRAAHAAFDGEGARRFGSRWTPRGYPAVFASATLSLAALERFVHLPPDLDAADLVAVGVDVPPAIAIETLELGALPEHWRTYPAPPVLASIGERWLRDSRSAVLSVPSAIVPQERNYILDPAHSDFVRFAVQPPEPFSFDPRMWKPPAKRGRRKQEH